MTKSLSKNNFTDGPLLLPILKYSIPIILSGLLQMCYNMADNIIVGKFSGDEFALAAVGATGELTRLIINLLMGIGAGAGIIVAQSYGAGNEKRLSKSVHTAITFSSFAGIAFAFLFFFISGPALRLMGINPDFIALSILYMKITAFGIPALAVFNYVSSILRCVGDSRTPLVILSISGITNVGLNLVFVIGCGMSVDGVALATVVSQYISAVISVIVIIKRKGTPYSFSFKKIGIDVSILKLSLILGIPQAIENSTRNLANVLLVSSMNTFDGYTFTAYTINCQLQSILDSVCTGFIIAATVFTAQNYGAKNLARVKKVLSTSIILVIASALLTAIVTLIFQEPLTRLFMPENSTNEQTILAVARSLNFLVLGTYFLMGILGVLSGSLRGLGRSVMQSALFLTGLCGTRILWIFAVFPFIKTPVGLMICFPVSWTVAIILIGTARLKVGKKLKKVNAEVASSTD